MRATCLGQNLCPVTRRNQLTTAGVVAITNGSRTGSIISFSPMASAMLPSLGSILSWKSVPARVWVVGLLVGRVVWHTASSR